MEEVREAARSLPPEVALDVLSAVEAYQYVIDVPGASPSTTEVDLTDDTLSIAVERGEAIPDGYERVSISRPGSLEFSLPVPPDVQGDEASATMDRGVLTLELPRDEEHVAYSIPVGSE